MCQNESSPRSFIVGYPILYFTTLCYMEPILGMFTKLEKKRLLALSLLLACTSIHMEQFGSHWTDFHEIWYFSIFKKSVEKIFTKI
jgi:hypothetical protein